MNKIIFSVCCFFWCCTVHADSWVPVVVVPSTVPQIIIPQTQQIIIQKPLVREIQYFLIPYVVEVNKPVIKRGAFGRLYIVNEKTLETYNVWQPVEFWK